SPVSALAIDPQNPSVLYAGTGRGVFKSTDSGASWQAIGNGLGTDAYVGSLAIDPQNSWRVYAVVHDLSTRRGGVLFKSLDGGANWIDSGLTLGVFASFLVINAQNPNTLYAGAYRDGVFKSTDWGG